MEAHSKYNTMFQNKTLNCIHKDNYDYYIKMVYQLFINNFEAISITGFIQTNIELQEGKE